MFYIGCLMMGCLIVGFIMGNIRGNVNCMRAFYESADTKESWDECRQYLLKHKLVNALERFATCFKD